MRPNNITPVKTDDGSQTYYNEHYDDIYHSRSGAVEEAFQKFAKPAFDRYLKIYPKIKKLDILDICFGLGYNSAAAIDLLRKHHPDIELRIDAIEIDINIIHAIQEVNPSFDCYKIFKDAFKKEQDHVLGCNFRLKLFIGDALKIVKKLPKGFDIVFHDPFSPKKHPDMWTLEFFRQIYCILNEGGMLLTYSCARKVRENLRDAGFKVSDGPSVGRRAPSTIAVK